ncbi:MAG: SEC-C domain-containing protein [Spirochaetales bacterium]|nr:SEC-C domain-containing protein [Spirochaetales bacterium]
MERNIESWRIAYARGKAFLSLHDPERALKSFEQALAECPVGRSKELGKILFFLGVTLKKLGLSGCALRSWSAARKLDKHNFSDKFLERFTNRYGMIRQETPELDDWNAFYSIQLGRYLATKRSKKIGTDAENDMIWDLIREGWNELRQSVDLSILSSCERLALFGNYRIVFPFFSVPAAQESYESIPVDFTRQRRISFDDKCLCGSGLPYRLCCGRIPCKDELAGGIF